MDRPIHSSAHKQQALYSWAVLPQYTGSRVLSPQGWSILSAQMDLKQQSEGEEVDVSRPLLTRNNFHIVSANDHQSASWQSQGQVQKLPCDMSFSPFYLAVTSCAGVYGSLTHKVEWNLRRIELNTVFTASKLGALDLKRQRACGRGCSEGGSRWVTSRHHFWFLKLRWIYSCARILHCFSRLYQ